MDTMTKMLAAAGYTALIVALGVALFWVLDALCEWGKVVWPTRRRRR